MVSVRDAHVVSKAHLREQVREVRHLPFLILVSRLQQGPFKKLLSLGPRRLGSLKEKVGASLFSTVEATLDLNGSECIDGTHAGVLATGQRSLSISSPTARSVWATRTPPQLRGASPVVRQQGRMRRRRRRLR